MHISSFYRFSSAHPIPPSEPSSSRSRPFGRESWRAIRAEPVPFSPRRPPPPPAGEDTRKREAECEGMRQTSALCSERCGLQARAISTGVSESAAAPPPTESLVAAPSLSACSPPSAMSGADFSLTTFSPSGKLVQIEYALNAVNAGKTSLGIKGEQREKREAEGERGARQAEEEQVSRSMSMSISMSAHCLAAHTCIVCTRMCASPAVARPLDPVAAALPCRLCSSLLVWSPPQRPTAL